MPIYEYQAKNPALGCDYCRNPFEVCQTVNEQPLTVCPKCEGPVTKLISKPAKPQKNILTSGNIADKGFVQYKKSGKGYYEKTAGKGPDTLHDDDHGHDSGRHHKH